MQADLLLPVVATILVTALIVYKRQEQVESAYETFDYVRRFLGAVLVVLIAFTFVRSGNSYLFAVALALIAFATIWFMVERPDKSIV